MEYHLQGTESHEDPALLSLIQYYCQAILDTTLKRYTLYKSN
jgi:hypothetical protein